MPSGKGGDTPGHEVPPAADTLWIARSEDFYRYQQMEAGWLLSRDHEGALIAATSLFLLLCAEFSFDFHDARAANQLSNGHRVLYSRTGRLLRLETQGVLL